MTNKTHRLAVFIGRFQPFHTGHRGVMAAAREHADSLLALVGSAYRPRSWKNPFRFDERQVFIEQGTEDLSFPINVLPLVDTLYNDRAWATNVRTAVRLHLRNMGFEPSEVEISLIGMEKDRSSAYLRWFPEWKMVPSEAHYHDDEMINATDMREYLFFAKDQDPANMAARFGRAHLNAVHDWMVQNMDAVEQIRTEGEYVKSYRARIDAAEAVFGYPISVNTADTVVVQSGHVLMVQRKHAPGKDLWALPGGHIDAGETAFEAAVRELYEEAGLDMPKGAMRSRLTKRQVFDHPERSEKGWVRTEAFMFELQDREKLEKVKGGSDAALARWVPITEITPDTIFEDHFDILQAMIPDLPFAYSSILMAHAQ